MIDLLYLYIFVLAAFVGYEVISRVPVILHTPLMSGSNFVHGVVLVGSMWALAHASTPFQQCRRRLRRHRTDAGHVRCQVRRQAGLEGGLNRCSGSSTASTSSSPSCSSSA